ncbi:alpha/beta fold hydrolase [Candidatus Woesearchaeota archaeon]|nr:alpha/beta fold hydrolase [Candidatus Woesearchaeota archaeon]
MKGSRLFKKKGKIGCLLVHGLTSSTQEMEELASYLHSKEYTVLAPLLKGHSASVKDLSKTTWQDWYSSVTEDFDFLNKNCDKIYVIGLSIGAMLSLHLAANIKNNKIKGLVLLAPAIFYTSPLAKFTPILKYFKKYSIKDYGRYYPGRKEAFFDIADEKALKDRIAYKQVPLESMASALKLIKIAKKEIKNIKVPTLIIHSKKDNTIKPKSSQFIYDALRISEKRIIYIQNSGHVISVDFDKKRIFKEICDFILETEKKK